MNFSLKIGHLPQWLKIAVLYFLFIASTAIVKAQEKITQSADQTQAIADTSKIYSKVDKSAVFPGGIDSLYYFLAKTIRYPRPAREKRVQGRVFVTFVVEKDGALSNYKILRGIGNGCDEEVIRVFKSSPKWIPGKQNGLPVRQQYTLPVQFSLLN